MRLPGVPRTRRTALFVAGDLLVFGVSLILAVLISYHRDVPSAVLQALPVWYALAVSSKLTSNTLFRAYSLTWEFVADRDLLLIALSALCSAAAWGLAATAVAAGTGFVGPSSDVLIVDTLFTLMGVGGLRLAMRMYRGAKVPTRAEDIRRILVVGAGDAGENLLRQMTHKWSQGYRPVGIVDDDPKKHDTYLHGVRVLGGRSDIPRIVAERDVQEVIVAIPSASGHAVREAVDLARKAGVTSVRIVPGVAAVLEGRITMETTREVTGEDLLPRETVEIDEGPVRAYLQGRTVLVTGAAGSIGSELARQIASFVPGKLVLVEVDETRLFTLDLELRHLSPRVAVRAEVADVRDHDRMLRLFAEVRPDVVFHAAAYKHVPLMESVPAEAVGTNVMGTKAVAEAAAAAGSDVFVLISTDKAVNPTSVMGATKRVAEMVVRRLNEVSSTRFSAVRFGNVLGSRGSLIPVLEEQIRRGGPVTITDPAMERYFMTVTEAVRLILTAGSIGTGGEVFVLDMGEPLRILDLVETLIRLSGLEPDVDVPIQFTGVRPGEKLREEILLAEEGVDATKHGHIFSARLGREPDPEALEQGVARLWDAAREGDHDRARAILAEVVSTYRTTVGALAATGYRSATGETGSSLDTEP